MVKSFTFFFVEEFTLAMLSTLKYIVYEASDRQGTLVQRRLNTPTSPLSAFRTPSHTKCLGDTDSATANKKSDRF